MLEPLLRNWPLKLLALGLAFVTWVSLTEERQPVVQDLSVPVDVILAEGFTIAGSSPTTAQLRIRGPEALVRRIDPLRHELELLVDLSDADQGERTVQFTDDAVVGLPAGLDVVLIVPDRVTLTLDEKVRRELPIVPTPMGDPPEGYSFYGATVKPPMLAVEGPRSQVDGMTRLRTDPIDLSGRTRSFVTRVGALPDSPEVRVLSAQLLEVSVEIDTEPTEVEFPKVPVVLAGQSQEATVSPASLRVVLSGPAEQLSQILPGHLRAVVDVSTLAPRAEPYHLSTRVDFMDVPAEVLSRVTVKSVSRDQVTVRVSERRTPR